MYSLFEQIDALEPKLTEEDLRLANACVNRIWQKDNPELWKAIVKRHNSKAYARRKREKEAMHGNQTQGGGVVSETPGRVCDTQLSGQAEEPGLCVSHPKRHDGVREKRGTDFEGERLQ